MTLGVASEAEIYAFAAISSTAFVREGPPLPPAPRYALGRDDDTDPKETTYQPTRPHNPASPYRVLAVLVILP